MHYTAYSKQDLLTRRKLHAVKMICIISIVRMVLVNGKTRLIDRWHLGDSEVGEQINEDLVTKAMLPTMQFPATKFTLQHN
jgi:hypothetical protein